MSSKRRLRRSKCERKIRYRSPGEARTAAREIAEKRNDFLSPYPCGSHWHLGHTPHNVNVAQAYKVAEFKARKQIDKRVVTV